ncbi:MAG: YdeI/OmpD-associated family protein, partial [Acidobacteriota bacterium]|nr:YdeI/OmpD-associated family protein [Acidobacteriota bacterium]
MAKTETKPAKTKRFRVLLERHPGMEATGITLPFDSVKFFGARGQIPVRCKINGHTFRSTIFPTGDGAHYMAVNRGVREAAGVRGGETITMEMTRDEEPRVVTPPADFARALKASAEARAAWDKLSYTHRREHV